jgi:hypothetical protein
VATTLPVVIVAALASPVIHEKKRGSRDVRTVQTATDFVPA